MKLVLIKALCRRANVEKLDAGPKGVTLAFRDNAFANPTGAGEVGRRAGLARRRCGPTCGSSWSTISRSSRTGWTGR